MSSAAHSSHAVKSRSSSRQWLRPAARRKEHRGRGGEPPRVASCETAVSPPGEGGVDRRHVADHDEEDAHSRRRLEQLDDSKAGRPG
jgi:hypothetical protein